jgi:hypothetical protein
MAMRVDSTRPATSGRAGELTHEAATAESAEPSTESRALVVLAPAEARETYTHHRQAAFLAQLIATKGHAPQTRERRRAEPSEALAAYRAAAALTRF